MLMGSSLGSQPPDNPNHDGFRARVSGPNALTQEDTGAGPVALPLGRPAVPAPYPSGSAQDPGLAEDAAEYDPTLLVQVDAASEGVEPGIAEYPVPTGPTG